MINLNREELAWAAGFFDGEGHTHLSNGYQLTIAISQSSSNRAVLERFRNAIGGFGRINKGGVNHRYKQKPLERFCTSSPEIVQAIIAMLWKWLDSAKRNQARCALLGYRDYMKTSRNSAYLWANGKCKRGHSITDPANIDLISNGQRRCHACRSEYYKDYERRIRAPRRRLSKIINVEHTDGSMVQ